MTAPDRADQRSTASRDAATPDLPVAVGEADAADLAEQAAAVGPGEHVADRELPLEADPADAAEQAVVVELDEDDHR